MQFQEAAELVGKAVDAAGVAVVVVGLAWASIVAATRLIQHRTEVYEQYRRLLGRSILLGLEFLVAGDIIRTVAIDPTFASVGVLGIIVIIRTFLSLSLELEITGRWPWQKAAPIKVSPAAD
nr:FecCD transport family [uncultured bacterium]ALS90827.1 FecCD transport family [uncultured bacterium]